MSSVTLDRFPNLIGKQSPFHESSFVGQTKHGLSCLKLAERLKTYPMPWQEDFVVKTLMVNDDGSWTHSEVVLIVPRQNR